MAAKTCQYCTTRRAVKGTPDNSMCMPCYNYGGAENTHTDESHEYYYAEDASAEIKAEAEKMVAEGRMTPHAKCIICQGAEDPATVEPTKGHSNGIAKTHTSHAACKHESTKSARAKCRKERAQSGE